MSATTLQRTAQRLLVDAQSFTGTPPTYSGTWSAVSDVQVETCELNPGRKHHQVTLHFPAAYWDGDVSMPVGTRVRVRSPHTSPDTPVCLFSGFVTGYRSSFKGGDEGLRLLCLDHRWLLDITSPVWGQYARGPDDYNATNYGTASQVPIDNMYTSCTGRRTVFNPEGEGNRDGTLLQLLDDASDPLCQVPIFADPDWPGATVWSARDMIRYCLAKFYNLAYDYFPITDPNALLGLSHSDFNTVLHHVDVQGKSVLQAVEMICKQLGWTFREEYDADGNATLVFYKIGAATAVPRDNSHPTILQTLYALDPSDDLETVVASGARLVSQMDLWEDIAAVINSPGGLGSSHRFEVTVELTPAWLDSDLTPDSTDSYAYVYLHEHELQDLSDKNSKDYYKYYHANGNSFKRDVGRKWVINDVGKYTGGTYDRGGPFDWSDVIADTYIRSGGAPTGARLFAPQKRQLLPCLTYDANSLNTVGVKVEVSYDGGTTWYTFKGAIDNLTEECGIYISEPNLADIVDPEERGFASGTLSGKEVNFWTSLCDDKLESRVFKSDQWQTRLRVTATVEMDQRLARTTALTTGSGSPFTHRKLWNWEEAYLLQERQASSSYSGGSLPTWDQDDTTRMDTHIGYVRTQNEDRYITGHFTLERFWLGEGSGEPQFMLGDGISQLAGRSYSLTGNMDANGNYPEIVRITYDDAQQEMHLFTRDLRFAATR